MKNRLVWPLIFYSHYFPHRTPPLNTHSNIFKILANIKNLLLFQVQTISVNNFLVILISLANVYICSKLKTISFKIKCNKQNIFMQD